ncbi:MAG: hypothetical protein ACLVJ6_00740 [Merdibacter sp.]
MDAVATSMPTGIQYAQNNSDLARWKKNLTSARTMPVPASVAPLGEKELIEGQYHPRGRRMGTLNSGMGSHRAEQQHDFDHCDELSPERSFRSSDPSGRSCCRAC